jgi:hypothetical protein
MWIMRKLINEKSDTDQGPEWIREIHLG